MAASSAAGSGITSNSVIGNSARQPDRAPLVSWYGLAVLGLLLVIAAELFFSTRQESQTFDESTHLFAGFEYWRHGDFGRNPEHPPLAKLIAALPLLPLHLKEPGVVPIPFFKFQDYFNASQFLYGRADADALLGRGRAMIAIFSLVLGFLVFSAGNEMFGKEVGLLALFLLAFEPVFLANGALITTDVPLTSMFFLSVYTFYRYVSWPSIPRLALCSAATALAVVTKHSGALIFLVLGLLAIAELLRHPGLADQGTATSQFLRSRAAALGLGILAIAVFSYMVLWAFYGFRYAARPGALQMIPSLTAYATALTSSAEKTLIVFCARHHLFPEAYLYGWVDILQIPGTRPTFLLGKLYANGKWFFFPAMFLIKSTLTLLVLLVAVPFAALWRRSRELTFLVVPAAAFLLIAVVSRLNLGVRHILPIYPLCTLLAAAAGWELARRSRALTAVLTVLLLFAAGSSLHAFPDYLAYSNEAFGGPSNTYRIVTDSNDDWGQGLKWTKQYLDRNHVTDCWFDNSNMMVDQRYYGIGCKPLPNAFTLFGFTSPSIVPPTITGNVLISGTEEAGLLWGPDVLNPYSQFKRLHPDAELGNVVMVYHGTFNVPLAAAYSNVGMAMVLMRQRRMPEALAEAQTAAKQAPDSAAIQAILGQALMASGRMAEGQQAIGNAIHLAQTIHPEFQGRLIGYLTQPPPH